MNTVILRPLEHSYTTSNLHDATELHSLKSTVLSASRGSIDCSYPVEWSLYHNFRCIPVMLNPGETRTAWHMWQLGLYILCGTRPARYTEMSALSANHG